MDTFKAFSRGILIKKRVDLKKIFYKEEDETRNGMKEMESLVILKNDKETKRRSKMVSRIYEELICQKAQHTAFLIYYYWFTEVGKSRRFL